MKCRLCKNVETTNPSGACKREEYEEVIRATYQAGGRVAIGVEWDW